jgi:hypothetical protein
MKPRLIGVAGPHPFLEVERSLLAPNDDVGVKNYRHLSAGALRFLRASSPQVTMPGHGFDIDFRQVHPGQSLGQIEAYTNLLAGWHDTGEWYAV